MLLKPKVFSIYSQI